MITNGNARHNFLFPSALTLNSPLPVTHLNCSRRLTRLSSWTHLTRTHVHTLMTAHNFAISILHPPTMISMISSVSQLRHLHNHQQSPAPCRQQLVALLLVVPPNNNHLSPRLRRHPHCLLVITPRTTIAFSSSSLHHPTTISLAHRCRYTSDCIAHSSRRYNSNSIARPEALAGSPPRGKRNFPQTLL